MDERGASNLVCLGYLRVVWRGFICARLFRVNLPCLRWSVVLVFNFVRVLRVAVQPVVEGRLHSAVKGSGLERAEDCLVTLLTWSVRWCRWSFSILPRLSGVCAAVRDLQRLSW